MRVTVNNELKIIQFWICEDVDNRELLLRIDTIAEKFFPDKNYKKIIYRSGALPLRDVACDLFRHNLRTLAKKSDTA